MKKNSLIDCLGYILLKAIGPFCRGLPQACGLFLGRRAGDLFYAFDLRHRARVYANIKTALGDKLLPKDLRRITKKFYRAYGQNIIDIFFLPKFSAEYMNKYVTIEGREHILAGLKKGKGVILLAVHEGSWELTNLTCVHLGFPFIFFARSQDYPRINSILNAYRRLHGCRIIERQNGARQLVEALKDNQVIGMTADQGGKDGVSVKFFGKEAAMSGGAIRMALKYDTAVIPAYYARANGPYVKIKFGPPLSIKKTGNPEDGLRNNLQEATHIFEGYIAGCPEEYLWLYKIWKYGRERNILILNDAKAGHLRQAQAVAAIAEGCLKEKGITVNIDTVEVEFKDNFSRRALIFSSCLSGKYHCQGCLWCLRKFLKEHVYKALIHKKFDLIISCGSSVAAVNYVLSRENSAKSIVVMRPSVLSTRRFGLVIMPRHDNAPGRKNVVAIDGALNLIDKPYLAGQVKGLVNAAGGALTAGDLYIGLLIGGDTKDFKLDKDALSELIRQVKAAAENSGAGILLTTSRRTSPEAERLLKEEFQGYPAAKLLIIANEKNIPEAVGGILGLSKVVVVSAESISMISEAASAGGYVIVFESSVGRRHVNFLKEMRDRKYIYLSKPSELALLVKKLLEEQPKINILQNNIALKAAFSGLGL